LLELFFRKASFGFASALKVGIRVGENFAHLAFQAHFEVRCTLRNAVRKQEDAAVIFFFFKGGGLSVKADDWRTFSVSFLFLFCSTSALTDADMVESFDVSIFLACSAVKAEAPARRSRSITMF